VSIGSVRVPSRTCSAGAFSRKARWSARGAVGRGERSYVDVGGDAREEEVLGDAPQLCTKRGGGGGRSLGCAFGEARRREFALHFFGSAGTHLDDEEDEAEEEEQNPPCLADRLGVLRAPCLVSRIRLACGIRPLEPSEPTFSHWSHWNPLSLSAIGTHGEGPTCSREPATSGGTRRCGGRVGRGTSLADWLRPWALDTLAKYRFTCADIRAGSDIVTLQCDCL
jgi:hypothetical protein